MPKNNTQLPRKKKTILVVSKSPDRYTVAWRALGLRGASLIFAESSSQARREAQRAPIDTIVVDDSALDDPGIQLCRAMRALAPAEVIVLISDHEADLSWAIDCQVPPTVAGEALARALTNAKKRADSYLLQAGDFTLDPITRQLQGPMGERQLTPKLAELMAFFLQHPDKPMARVTIMQQVWMTAFVGDLRTLEVHICMLRRIVEPDPRRPRYLVTQRKAGYLFHPGGSGAISA